MMVIICHERNVSLSPGPLLSILFSSVSRAISCSGAQVQVTLDQARPTEHAGPGLTAHAHSHLSSDHVRPVSRHACLAWLSAHVHRHVSLLNTCVPEGQDCSDATPNEIKSGLETKMTSAMTLSVNSIS